MRLVIALHCAGQRTPQPTLTTAGSPLCSVPIPVRGVHRRCAQQRFLLHFHAFSLSEPSMHGASKLPHISPPAAHKTTRPTSTRHKTRRNTRGSNCCCTRAPAAHSRQPRPGPRCAPPGPILQGPASVWPHENPCPTLKQGVWCGTADCLGHRHAVGVVIPCGDTM